MKICLIGFMGSGKSCVGRLLAKSLDYDFLEMDSQISQDCNGLSISEIFETLGQEHFRKCEELVAKSISETEQLVVSTGGGVVEYPKTLSSLKNGNSLLVFLDTSLEEITKRLSSEEEKSKRPLFCEPQQFANLYHRRLPLYREAADIELLTDTLTPEKIAATIISQINSSN